MRPVIGPVEKKSWKCLNIGENIYKSIYQSISNYCQTFKICLIFRQKPFRESTWEFCSFCFVSDLSAITRWVFVCINVVFSDQNCEFCCLIGGAPVFPQVPLSENVQYPMLYEWVTPIMSVYMRMWVFLLGVLQCFIQHLCMYV